MIDLIDLERLAELNLEYYSQLRICQSESANIFRQIREKNNWTQRKLAELLGCTYPYISKIENGHFVASAVILVKLSEVLKEKCDE
jgi:DNA-binding XRE family transcriptional regulator